MALLWQATVTLLAALCAGCATRASAPAPAGARTQAAEPRQAAAPARGVPPELVSRVEQLLADVARGGQARVRARSELKALGEQATLPLVDNLRSPNPDVRWEITNVLGDLEDFRATAGLIERVLHDPDGHVRWRAIWALGEQGDPSTPDRFRQRLASEDPGERWNATVGASMFGVVEALPLLKQGVDSADDFSAWEAVYGLAKIHDEQVVELLAGVLASRRKASLRREAVLTLGKLDYETATRVLIDALADRDPEVRWRAAMVLGRHDRDEVRAALLARLAGETHPMTREKLRSSLQQLGVATPLR